MKVGDLVKWYSVENDLQEEFDVDTGILIQLSRTGHETLSALVLFEDGKLEWISTLTLEVVNESR